MPKKIAALLFVCFCFLPLQASGGDDLAKKGKARIDAAEKAYKAWRKGEPSQPFTDLLYQLSIRWLNAEVDVATKKEQRIAAYEAHLNRLKDWDKIWKGSAGRDVFAVIESYQREADFWLAKERSVK